MLFVGDGSVELQDMLLKWLALKIVKLPRMEFRQHMYMIAPEDVGVCLDAYLALRLCCRATRNFSSRCSPFLALRLARDPYTEASSVAAVLAPDWHLLRPPYYEPIVNLDLFLGCNV